MKLFLHRLASILAVALSAGMFCGCFPDGGHPTTAPATQGSPALDPLPRLLDNLPGENHFWNIIQLTDGGSNRHPSWSPTGQELAFLSVRPPHSSRELYLMAVDGSGLRQIAGVAELASDQQWAGRALSRKDDPNGSPTGTQECFHGFKDEDDQVKEYFGVIPPPSDGPGQLNIYIRNADGSAVAEVVNNGSVNATPCFSPNGKQLVFTSNSGDGYDLYIVDVESKAVEKITTSAGFDGDPLFVGDGSRLAFVSQRNDDDRSEINVFVADWVASDE